jgi:hypothetical protein
MSTANTWGNPAGTVGTLNGLFKETYAEKLKNLIPDGVKLMNKIKFLPKEKMPGNLYHQPVILGLEHGVTFASSDEDAFNLAAPVAGSIKDAQVKGNPAVLRSVLGYVAASRSVTSQEAFEQGTKFLVANMLRSMAKKIEIELLYGQMGYGVVGSVVGSVVTVSTAEWAPGIWAGAEQMPIEIRDASGATSRGNFTVVSVNMDLRTITLNAAPASAIATDVIWHGGAYGNEFAGIHFILTVSSGSLFNINVSQYNLFRGNQYPAGGAPLSFTKMTHASARAVEKGLDSMLYCLINPRAWADLLFDQAALRRYDSSYSNKEAVNGMQSIKFYSQNGELEIEPSIYVKEGYAYMISPEEWFRVGSSDLTFKRPGQGDEFFRDLENAAGYELRAYTDQALFCCAPGHNVIITGIVNNP